MTYKKPDFKKHIESIKIDGFKLKNATQAYLFIRKYSNRTETMILSYLSFSPIGFYISGVSANVCYPEVEDILRQYGLERESTFRKSFPQKNDGYFQKLQIKINSEETFNSVKEVVEDIIEKGVMPFFARFSTLEKIANFLAEKKREEIRFYIQGPILFPKTILIMKLAKHPDFKKKLIEFRDILLKDAHESEEDLMMLNKYNEIFAKDLKTLES